MPPLYLSCVESEQHQQFCNDKGVNGFPTIMAFGRSAQGGVKQGVELEMSQNGYPAVSAMQIAATILELNKVDEMPELYCVPSFMSTWLQRM